MMVGAFVTTALAGIFATLQANAILIFVVSGLALALLAALVGQGTDQVGARLGPGATGGLQSALGNLQTLCWNFCATGRTDLCSPGRTNWLYSRQ